MTALDQWLILIEEKEVVVALVLADNKLTLAKQKEWSGQSKDDLLVAIDAGMGECLSSVGVDEGPSDSIFVISPWWVDEEGEVLETRKQILKEICEKLKLSPVGFLVGDEALAEKFDNFLSVYFAQNQLRISVVYEGKVKWRKQLEEGISFEPEEFLKELTKAAEDRPLPSTLVFWGVFGEGLVEKINDYNWGKDGIFGDIPQIKIINWEELFRYFNGIITGKSEDKEVTSDGEVAEENKEETSFGFINEDIAENLPKLENQDLKEKVLISTEASKEEVEDSLNSLKNESIKKRSVKFPKITKINFGFIKNFAISLSDKKRGKILFLAPLLALLFILVSWYFSSATVEIYTTTETLEQEVDVEINTAKGELIADKKSFPVKKAELVLDSEKSMATTGEKLVGEKAKGEVIVFNRTGQVKILKAGTGLTGPGGLKFIFDDEVKIASKTPDLVSGVDRWGEVKAPVTSADIGSDYNLAKGSIFAVAGISSDELLVKNENSFSGGTSRRIQTVAQGDIDDIRTELLSEMKKEAEEKLPAESADGRVLKESLVFETVEEDINADVGEEAETLVVNLKVKFQAAVILEEKLALLAKDILENKIPSGSTLSSTSIDVNLKVNTVEDSLILGRMKIGGKIYPDVDSIALVNNLVGKRKNVARDIVRSYPRVYNYQLNFTPKILGWFPFLPPKAGSIKIEIKE